MLLTPFLMNALGLGQEWWQYPQNWGGEPLGGVKGSALPKAACGPQSDCLWPRGMAGRRAKFQRGESLCVFTDRVGEGSPKTCESL